MQFIISTILFLAFSTYGLSADFRTGTTIIIETTSDDDLYLAGQNINSLAPVFGDLIAAGRNINISDTISEDALLAAESIIISSIISDDVRAFTRSFNLSGIIQGDLILFAADALIDGKSIIEGDLIVYSGDVIINGLVKGKLIVKAGTVTINGTVMGPVSVEAEDVILNSTFKSSGRVIAGTIQINENFNPEQPVNYWQESGQLKTRSEKMIYDPSLAEEYEVLQEDKGVFTATFIWQILAGLLALIILHALFKGTFRTAGDNLLREPAKTVGFGLLYLVAIPLACVFLLITVIGIPIGMFLLAFYIFSLLFALVIASLAGAYFVRLKRGSIYSFWTITGIAALIYLIIKFILLIPYMGVLIWIVVAGLGLGALVTAFSTRRGLRSAK